MSEIQVVVFSLNDQLFAAEASQVFQIIKYTEGAKILGMPEFIEGVLEYRDSELPLINLAERFDMGEFMFTKKAKILVVKMGDKFAGFIVNDVSEIVKFLDEEIEAAPITLNSEVSSFLKKIGKKDNKLIYIIDLEKVLNDSEIKKLSVKMPKA